MILPHCIVVWLQRVFISVSVLLSDIFERATACFNLVIDVLVDAQQILARFKLLLIQVHI